MQLERLRSILFPYGFLNPPNFFNLIWLPRIGAHLAMDIYAISAAVCHVGSRKLLLFKLLWEKHCRGVSLITQELLLIVFITRYLDLLYLFVNALDEVVKASRSHGGGQSARHGGACMGKLICCLKVVMCASHAFYLNDLGCPPACVPRRCPHHAILAGSRGDLRRRPRHCPEGGIDCATFSAGTRVQQSACMGDML